MTLGLFGPGHAADRLLDDQPVLSGRHPLHLYHGLLGARSFLNRGAPLLLRPRVPGRLPQDARLRRRQPAGRDAAGRWRAAAICRTSTRSAWRGLCLLAPCVFAGAARGAGLNRFRACLACGLGMLVWWGKPCRDLLEAGDVELLLAIAGRARADRPAAALPPRAGAARRGRRGADGLPRLVRPPDAHGAFGAAVPASTTSPSGARHRLLWHVSLAAALAAGRAGQPLLAARLDRLLVDSHAAQPGGAGC